jgi:hypothetical protein
MVKSKTEEVIAQEAEASEAPVVAAPVVQEDAFFLCDKYPSLKVLVRRKGTHERDEFVRFYSGECHTSDPDAIATLSRTRDVYRWDGNYIKCPSCGFRTKRAGTFAAHFQSAHV